MVEREKFSAAIFRRGQKAELFGDADELAAEEVELNSKLEELHEIWKLPRAGKDLAAAIWRPQHRAAEIVLQKGRLLNHMGFMWRGKLYLHIEEAVYLVDRANLLLFVDKPKTGKQLLSLQECQELMMASGVTMDMYVVFCKLLRAGYIVQRHPSAWVVKSSESPSQIWSSPIPYNSSTARLAQENNTSATLVPADRPAKRARVEETETEPLRKPDAAPQNVSVEVHKRWWVSTTQWLAKGHSKNASSKEQLDGQVPADLDFIASLPRCRVEMTRAQRVQSLFPNLQPLSTIAPLELVDLPTINKDGASMLHLDVFASNGHFSRKAAGKPLFTIAVCEGGAPPVLTAVNAADEAAGGVPVRYSTVERGDIAYYATARTELKNILS